MFIADSLNICDPVLAFDKIMGEIGIEQYGKAYIAPFYLSFYNICYIPYYRSFSSYILIS